MAHELFIVYKPALSHVPPFVMLNHGVVAMMSVYSNYIV